VNARAKFAAMAVALGCAISGNVGAVGLGNDFPYLLQDPLLTRPPVLDQGAALPGGGASLACATLSPESQHFKDPLMLETAVDMALCHNPQVKVAWATIKVQAGALGEARAAYLPALNATMSQLRNNTRYPDSNLRDVSNEGQTKYANLTWRLFDFGTRSANLESANQLLLAALASHDAALQKVLTTVVGAYFDAMTAQATLKARTQAVDLATGTWKTTQRREARGVSAVSDTLQAAAALTKAKLALSRAQGDAQKTRSVLLYAMGMPLDMPLGLPDEHAAAAEASVQDLAQWLHEAQKNHPAITAARAQLAASKAKIQAVQAEGLPTLDYMQNHYQNGYPNQGLSATNTKVNTLGFTLNVPLFEGLARTYKVRGVQAQSEQSEAQLQDTELQVLMEVVKAHADAQSSLANLHVSQQLLSATEAAVQSSQKRYDKGVADILELLSTQSALADAQQERVRCLSDWRSARLRLLSGAGVLGREGLIN
jgi:outer membrane protein